MPKPSGVGSNEERFEEEQEININVIEESVFEEPWEDSAKELVERGQKFGSLIFKRCQNYLQTQCTGTMAAEFSGSSRCFTDDCSNAWTRF